MVDSEKTIPPAVLPGCRHILSFYFRLCPVKNTVIFKEGEIGDCMYIIHQGEVRIHKSNTTLAVLKEREVFGELALLDPEVRSATATADSNCILFRIDQEPLYEVIENRPEVARGFIKILCQRLRAQNEKSIRMAP
jgi:CRP/FNR family transcriptional regulator, cyclic AMP receptor protein